MKFTQRRVIENTIANTMWYLQFHFVCTKLFVSFIFEYTALLHSLQLTNRISTIAARISCFLIGSGLSLQLILNHSSFIYPPLIGRILFATQKSDDRLTVALCWRYLSSQAVASQVLSTEMSLTTVFGMGTGGPSS